MGRFFFTIVLFVMLILVTRVGAQNLQENENQEQGIVALLGRKIPKNDEVIALFYLSQLPHFQDPRAPRFLFYDKKRKVALGIGGYVKLTASCDFKGITDNLDFVTYTIPVPNNNLQNGQFQMDASASRLFLKLVGKNTLFGEYTAYVESDFRGPGYSLRLRQAYIEMLGVLAGQSWSTFTDIVAFPPSVDFEGPSPNTALRNLQVRYTRKFGYHWQLAMAVENPSVGMTTNEYTKSIAQRMPDIPLYVQYGWGKKNHIRLSGVFRGLSYHNVMTRKNRMRLGWGVQASGIANLTPRWICFFHAIYGKGVAKYLADVTSANLDLVYQPDHLGEMSAVPIWGAYIGVRYNFSNRIFLSANYGQARVHNENGVFTPQNYRNAQYVAANMFFNVSANCQLGLEYLWGQRVNINNEQGRANRVQTMVQYNF